MTDPLTHPDCDLRGLPFMPLDVVRLIDSDLFALSTGDEFKAAVALWCKSWGQVPAASLPNDDRILSHLSGAKQWKRVREIAMRGWVLCSDGRWYHPVIAEKAIEAMDRREDWQEANENKKTRQQRWRERCKALGDQLRSLGVTPPRGASLETLEQMLVDAETSTSASTQASTCRDSRDAVEIGKTGTGTGTGIKEKDNPHSPPDGELPLGDAASPETPKLKRERGTTLAVWLDRCVKAGEKPISEYEPLARYVRESGLPIEFVNLAWQQFKRDFLPGGKSERKLQIQWRRHFQNFVEKNYFKLWYAKPAGDGVTYELTTVGLQAQMSLRQREAA